MRISEGLALASLWKKYGNSLNIFPANPYFYLPSEKKAAMPSSFKIDVNDAWSFDMDHETVEDENLSLQDKELELITKALERNHGKRKDAAKELGISERTLYRKIKQYEL